MILGDEGGWYNKIGLGDFVHHACMKRMRFTLREDLVRCRLNRECCIQVTLIFLDACRLVRSSEPYLC